MYPSVSILDGRAHMRLFIHNRAIMLLLTMNVRIRHKHLTFSSPLSYPIIPRRCSRLPHVGAGARLLFRRSGEKQLLWILLQAENPWKISSNKGRDKCWKIVARKVLEVRDIEVHDKDGERLVHVNVGKGKVSQCNCR